MASKNLPTLQDDVIGHLVREGLSIIIMYTSRPSCLFDDSTVQPQTILGSQVPISNTFTSLSYTKLRIQFGKKSVDDSWYEIGPVRVGVRGCG